jgi:hypothetical protein
MDLYGIDAFLSADPERMTFCSLDSWVSALLALFR